MICNKCKKLIRKLPSKKYDVCIVSMYGYKVGAGCPKHIRKIFRDAGLSFKYDYFSFYDCLDTNIIKCGCAQTIAARIGTYKKAILINGDWNSLNKIIKLPTDTYIIEDLGVLSGSYLLTTKRNIQEFLK